MACGVAFGVDLVVALGVALGVACGVELLVADGAGPGEEAAGAGVEGAVLPPSALPVELLEPNCGGVIAKTAPSEPTVPTPISNPRFISLSLLF